MAVGTGYFGAESIGRPWKILSYMDPQPYLPTPATTRLERT